ncbi:hypothetical protein Pcinc_024015 [Petrolisthes cinctipes]|uniref:Uncharacterized protein n=1 Tax=Petrolisthes cinctipes TaxID=88211 RepID=A0AAE1FC97_PETCI|nr:hypothetical protein Pcinc_024015 [Petrolisthes cinctipes]
MLPSPFLHLSPLHLPLHLPPLSHLLSNLYHLSPSTSSPTLHHLPPPSTSSPTFTTSLPPTTSPPSTSSHTRPHLLSHLSTPSTSSPLVPSPSTKPSH